MTILEMMDLLKVQQKEIDRLKLALEADNQEIMRINNDLRTALLAIKAECTGDKIPNWKDDWATTATRGFIMDIIDGVVR